MTRIRIRRLTIHNFMSFQDEEWDFDGTNRLVLVKGINRDTETAGGKNTSNGSGKSSLANALMFALYGQMGARFHIANLKNQYASEMLDGFKMSVEVEVDTISPTKTTTWRIRRGMQKATSMVVQLFVQEKDERTGELSWRDISKSTGANTQKYIDEHAMMMDFETYQRIVMLSVEDKFNFFRLNSTQKREFVETLFDTAVYSRMYREMCDDAKGSAMLVQGLKATQARLEKSKEVCEDEIQRWKDSVAARIETARTESQTLEGQLEQTRSRETELASAEQSARETLEKVRAAKSKLDSLVSECRAAATRATADAGSCRSNIATHQKALDRHREVLSIICDDCKRAVGKFYSLDEHRQEIERLEGQVRKDEAVVQNSARQESQVRKYVQQMAARESQATADLNDRAVDRRNLVYQQGQISSAISRLEKTIADLTASMDDPSRIPSYAILQKAVADLEETERELKAEVERLCLLKIGAEIVSPESIKRNIVSKVVSSINSMLNQNLAELGATFKCEISQDMNDYQISSEGGSLDFPNLSFGERMKLIISTQLAFRRFFLSRFNVCANVMLIDEVVDRGLDSVSIQKLLGMLLLLSQKEGTNISIISHRSEVEQMFSSLDDTQMLVIQKENNISRILR